MTTEFLVAANVVLVLRCFTLFSSAPCSFRRWAGRMVIELLMVLLLQPSGAVWGLATTVIVMTFAEWLGTQSGSNACAWQLLSGVAHVLLLSIWLSPGMGLHFRPGLSRPLGALAQWTTFGLWLHRFWGFGPLKTLFGLIISANEANLLVRWVLEKFKLPVRASTDEKEYNRGRIIGLLEREMIYLFVLGGQFSAIGFVMAAKGLARFKELEDRNFAEYVLIGTLVSSSVAMAVGLAIRT
jgi:hypothetical protein